MGLCTYAQYIHSQNGGFVVLFVVGVYRVLKTRLDGYLRNGLIESNRNKIYYQKADKLIIRAGLPDR